MHTLRKRRLRAEQVWRKASVGPNRTERRVLEAIGKTGGLYLQYQGGRQFAALGDGTPLSRLGRFDVSMAIELGWLHPDPGSPSLLPDYPAQRYFASSFTSIEGNQQP